MGIASYLKIVVRKIKKVTFSGENHQPRGQEHPDRITSTATEEGRACCVLGILWSEGWNIGSHKIQSEDNLRSIT
jgi:hypothetical protein